MKQEELENYIYTYGKDLYSFCCCMTHSRQEADDLYQDTFLKVFEMGEKLVIRSNPKSFLMSIALNLYRNYKRKLSVRQRIAGTANYEDEMVNSVVSTQRAVEDVMVSDEEHSIVRQMVQKLSDKYRIPILLYYMEELSITEIAGILQMSENTVKTRLRRAKKILREKLEGQL